DRHARNAPGCRPPGTARADCRRPARNRWNGPRHARSRAQRRRPGPWPGVSDRARGAERPGKAGGRAGLDGSPVLISIAVALVVAAAILWAARELVAEVRNARTEAMRTRALAVLQTFSAGITAAHSDPRALITWVPLARAARQMLPAEFAL